MDEVLPVQVLDSATIAQMREQNRRLLLENRSAPESAEAPKDARFASDRNVRVEREQRAREGEAIARRARENPADLSRLGVGLRPPPSAAALTGANVEKLIDDPDLAIGAENMLSSTRSVYYSFFARLEQETLPVWQSSIRTLGESVAFPPGEFTTVVEVVLRADGALEDIRTLLSSGYSQLDRAAENSWRKLERYPNPPQALLEKDGRLRMRWGYKVINSASAFRVLPPTRLE
jgi:TonB family protein